VAEKDRSVLVATITTMGVVIAALITSGYFTRNSAAKREDAMEARIRELQAELSVCQHSVVGPPAKPSPDPAKIDQSTPLSTTDLVELSNQMLTRVAGSERLAVGAAARAVLAENAVRKYVFVGRANSPILFSLDQPRQHFSVNIDILSSGGSIVLAARNFYGSENHFSFTPLKDDAYVIEMTGKRKYGDFVLEMAPLSATPP
jgi:hypothetical protein